MCVLILFVLLPVTASRKRHAGVPDRREKALYAGWPGAALAAPVRPECGGARVHPARIADAQAGKLALTSTSGAKIQALVNARRAHRWPGKGNVRHISRRRPRRPARSDRVGHRLHRAPSAPETRDACGSREGALPWHPHRWDRVRQLLRSERARGVSAGRRAPLLDRRRAADESRGQGAPGLPVRRRLRRPGQRGDPRWRRARVRDRIAGNRLRAAAQRRPALPGTARRRRASGVQ